MNKLTLDQEYDRIMAIYGTPEPIGALNLLERQLVILSQRAQMLLGLCGIVITVTGFSGRIIAGTNRLAQVMIISGVSLILVAAGIIVGGVIHLYWLTEQPIPSGNQDSMPDLVRTGLSYRKRKMHFYRGAVFTLMLGLTCYVIAIAIMLLYPHASTVSPAR
jgi:hypothetical protein